MSEPRWTLSEAEKERLKEADGLGVKDVLTALAKAPSLIPRAMRSAVSGARQGLRDDPSMVWHLSGMRLRQAAPGAATGALWYGDTDFVEVMTPYLSEHSEVLEIGAGAGRVSRLVAPKVRRLVCTDPVETLLSEAEVNLAGIDNVEFVRVEGGAVDRVLGEGSFQLAFAHDVFVTIDPDPTVAILDATRRALTPNGHCIASFATVDHAASRAIQLKLVREAATKGRFGHSHPRTYTEDQVRAMFEMAGFEVVAGVYSDTREDERPHYIVVGQAVG